MVGELFKTKLGWVIRYPIEKNLGVYDSSIIPVINSENFMDSDLGKKVTFSIIIKKNKKFKGKSPYAKLET